LAINDFYHGPIKTPSKIIGLQQTREYRYKLENILDAVVAGSKICFSTLPLDSLIYFKGEGERERERERERETVHLWDTQDQWRPVVSLDQKGKNFTAIEWVRTASDNDCLKLWFHIYHQKIK
jgi:hypothetical protein